MTSPTPSPASKSSWGGILIAVAAFVPVTGGLIYLMSTVGTERLQAMVKDAGPLAPLVYMLLRALNYVFAPLTTGPIQFASGAWNVHA